MVDPSLQLVAADYLGVSPDNLEVLGWGTDGIVYHTLRTAVKTYYTTQRFQTELEVYKRLAKKKIDRVGEHHIPQLINYSEKHQVVEMTIVKPPYILDFAKAYIDRRPDFPKEFRRDWKLQKMEIFGDDWPTVASIYDFFVRRIRVYLDDLSLYNISFNRPELPDDDSQSK